MLNLLLWSAYPLRLSRVAGPTLKSSVANFSPKDPSVRYDIDYIPEAEGKGWILHSRPNSLLYGGLASLFTVPKSSTRGALFLANPLK